ALPRRGARGGRGRRSPDRSAARRHRAEDRVSADADLLARAHAWADDDPDDATAAELRPLAERATAGDADALADLADRFAGTLQFGTAGLRGALGAGPMRMNRAVVIRAAAGLSSFLREDRKSVVKG